jgi:hypothetical protein
MKIISEFIGEGLIYQGYDVVSALNQTVTHLG